MRLIDRDVNRGLAVERQPTLVSRSRRSLIRGQGARRAVVLNPKPAQFERRVEPDGNAEARHQFAVFLPRDRAASGSNDRPPMRRGLAQCFSFKLPEPFFAFALDQFDDCAADFGLNYAVEINEPAVEL